MAEILFEFLPQGAYVKVVAVDADTGQEVSIIGDASRSQDYLQELALKKLQYVITKVEGHSADAVRPARKNTASTDIIC